MHVVIAVENVRAGWKLVGVKSSTGRFMKLCFHAKLYQMDNIFFICFAVRRHELNVGMDVHLGDYVSISFHVKLKCAKLYINLYPTARHKCCSPLNCPLYERTVCVALLPFKSLRMFGNKRL